MIVFNVGTKIIANISKMISVSGQKIEWNRKIAINNNTVILPGNSKSLLFNFDNRKIVETVIEDGVLTEPVDIPADRLIENATNILLYAFGKWGLIKGMKVEKDYDQLNALYNTILQEISVIVESDDQMCKFYKDSIQITYEDVFEIILKYLTGEEDDSDETINEKIKNQDTEDNKLGLWHKLVWKNIVMAIEKKKLDWEERENDRLGMNFYKSAYICPQCGSNLHMTVYKEDEEKVIDTKDGNMYMTRCYTCHSCHMFLTPRPDLLVIEGDEYILDFEDDEDAYFDFLRLAGNTGGKFSNSRFNWMVEKKESDEAVFKKTPVNEILNKMLGKIQEITDSELITVADCADSGFFLPEEQGLIVERAHREMARRGMDINTLQTAKMRSILKKDALEFSRAQYLKKKEREKEKNRETIENHLKETEKPDLGMEGENWKSKQVKSSRKLEEEVNIAVNLAKRNEADSFGKLINHFNVKQLLNTRNAINSLINMETNNGHGQAESTRALEAFVRQIDEKNVVQTDRELALLFASIPDTMSKEEYLRYRKKIEEYDDEKSRPYLEKLKNKWIDSEQQRLLNYVKKNVKNGRNIIYNTCMQLEEDNNFSEEVKRPIIDKLMERIRSMDQARIDKMCANLDDLDFESGQQLINMLKKENILPELLEDAIEKIRRRLIQLKKDECGRLVRKLTRDTGLEAMEVPGFVVYDVRRMSNDSSDDADAILFHNAVYEYASGREFEFPLLLYDSTKAGNGKRGFILTPDRIAYNLSSAGGSINIIDIMTLYVENGVFNKGIYVQGNNGYTYKIANILKPAKQELEEIIQKLNVFIKYLKEKPDSHNVDYLAKESHEQKICVRCGFRYSEGSTCPKCGSKNL